MISIALATALAAAAAPATPPTRPRELYATCLNRFLKASMAAKMEPDAFKTAARTTCAAEETAFRKAMVDYDVKMGAKRAAAEEGVLLEVDDYLTSTTETYQ
ncbi:MAG TPA: hypothetical protein VNT25_03785, partial [Allosphingosinicella sp.]|nr:hypothetical protein [Allosphingosinicella sp.]